MRIRCSLPEIIILNHKEGVYRKAFKVDYIIKLPVSMNNLSRFWDCYLLTDFDKYENYLTKVILVG
jgi:hypothetical protein